MNLTNRVDEKELIELTKSLIQIKSPCYPGEYGEIIAFVKDKMEEIGMRVKTYPLFPYEEGSSKVNLIGTLGQCEKTGLLFYGHVDTVGVDEHLWTVPPFGGIVKEGRIYGRGATDMKGAVAAMLVAMKTLKSTCKNLKKNVQLLITVDEEVGKVWQIKYLMEKGIIDAEALIVGEPSGVPGAIQVTIYHRGIAHYDIIAEGKTSHSNTPEKGVNAIYTITEIVQALREKGLKYQIHPYLGNSVFNICHIQGGSRRSYTVPAFCKAELEVRLVPGQTVSSVKREIKTIIESLRRKDPKIKAEVEFTDANYKDPSELSKNHPLTKLLCRIIKELTGKYPNFGTGGGGEAYWFLKAGLPAVYLGPGEGPLCHEPDEYVSINNLILAANTYLLTAEASCC